MTIWKDIEGTTNYEILSNGNVRNKTTKKYLKEEKVKADIYK